MKPEVEGRKITKRSLFPETFDEFWGPWASFFSAGIGSKVRIPPKAVILIRDQCVKGHELRRGSNTLRSYQLYLYFCLPNIKLNHMRLLILDL